MPSPSNPAQAMTVDGVPITVESVLEKHHCAICGSPNVVAAGAYAPTEAIRKRFVANTIEAGMPRVPEGKERVLVYAVCSPCWSRGTDFVMAEVEAQFLGNRQRRDIEI
jgi:hypothetical protein